MSTKLPSPGPLCFVLMPFGQKPNPTPPPPEFNFDAVYRNLIAPAVASAGMEPLRADEEMSGGLIHKPMYERLVLCEFAVADLTAANANVFYELGIRHAVRPWSTVLIFAEGARLPFDVAPLRGLRYPVTESGEPRDTDTVIQALSARLCEARSAVSDSPLYQTLPGFLPPDLTALQASSFDSQARITAGFQDRMKESVETGELDGLSRIEAEIGDLSKVDSALIVALFYSYRALGQFGEMVRLFAQMPDYVASTVPVQEQYALALNRTGDDARAERILLALTERRGPSSETYGILGRIYKDRWKKAIDAGKLILAQGLLDKAIDAYMRGFDSDPRDYYPGVNALTLMEMRQPPDPRCGDLLPAVRYSLDRKIRSGQRGYWEYATALELAVLGGDQSGAATALSSALAAPHQSWMSQSTRDNLQLIRTAREHRGTIETWLQEIESEL
jgi:tetratricopeptide (TPR) repeat protein